MINSCDIRPVYPLLPWKLKFENWDFFPCAATDGMSERGGAITALRQGLLDNPAAISSRRSESNLPVLASLPAVLQKHGTNMKPFIFLAALALISCDRKTNDPSGSGNLVIDDGLRGLYSVRSISGSFEAPKGMNYYILTTLEFEDGKLIRRGPMISNSTESLHGGSSSAQFLWGEQNGSIRTALVASGSASRAENDFWDPLMSTTNFRNGSGPEYEGYRILGMAQSDATRDGIGDKGIGPHLDRALEERMFVGVLVVRFFPTSEEVDNFSVIDLSSREKDAGQGASGDGN